MTNEQENGCYISCRCPDEFHADGDTFCQNRIKPLSDDARLERQRILKIVEDVWKEMHDRKHVDELHCGCAEFALEQLKNEIEKL